ncbi:hypothetical protein [Priestia megaterium]|uniref:hypothetical protein n=1 Tax=Priestia megaterium TaxID=1404 RepID=UPI00316B9E5B
MGIDFKDIEFKPFNEVCKNRYDVSNLVNDFDCGVPVVNSFLKEYYSAYYNHILGIATTNLMFYRDEFIGYFTSRCTSIEVDANEAKKIGGILQVPAIELYYIGIDNKFRGLRIGEYVIKVLIGQAIAINKTFACRYFFLRSIPERVAYYTDPDSFDFEVVGQDEDGLFLLKHFIPDFFDFDEFEDHVVEMEIDDERDTFFKELDGE